MALFVKIVTVILSLILVACELAVFYGFWLTLRSYIHRDPSKYYASDEEDIRTHTLILMGALMVPIFWIAVCTRVFI